MTALDAFQPAQLIQDLQSFCLEAGAAILEIYQRDEDIEVSRKQDNTPVTEADHASHRLLTHRFSQLTPKVPIISEESDNPNPQNRVLWPQCWMLDPLDGTAEFLAQTDEFTINIAFIDRTEPILGVVYHPISQSFYIGGPWLEGAWCFSGKQSRELHSDPLSQRLASSTQPIRLLGSRRHGLQKFDTLIHTLEDQLHPVEHIRCGSALKFCRLAEGEADLYARFGATSEWDTAAGQALLNAAGGLVVTHNFDELKYNVKSSIINPEFFAFADGNFDWRPILLGSLANSLNALD